MMNDERSPLAGRCNSERCMRALVLGSAAAIAVAALTLGPTISDHALSAFLAPSAAYAEVDQWHGPTSFAPLVDRVKSAVVSVRVRLTESRPSDQVLPIPRNSPFYRFFQGPGQQEEIITGEGSGFFISPDGYIATNDHVVDHAKTAKVTTTNGDIYTAKVVGTDPGTDLALLKVESNKQFPYVKFADHPPKVGDWVIAVGNPFGLGGTVTAGIVSARGRNLATNPYDSFMQIDAPINKGNSGGPAFNMNGNVVGVNTAIYSPSGGSIGIGFDIPASTAKRVIDQLEQKGYVARGWLGVGIQPVTPAIADSLGMKKAEGALVAEAQPDSPAKKAGIKAGDVILDVDGQQIKNPRALADQIATATPGSEVQVTVLRDGKTQELDVTLGKMPNQQREANARGQPRQHQQPMAEPKLGLTLAPAKDVQGSGSKGVVVLSVNPTGPAAQNEVQSGDVILDAGGKTVETPSQVRQAINQTYSEGKHAILMRMKTAQGTRFVALPIG